MRLLRKIRNALESWERRRYRRYRLRPLQVVLQDRPYTTLDWSLGGFLVGDFKGHIRVGQRVSGHIGPVGGFGPGHFVAEAKWCGSSGRAGFQFEEIEPIVFMAMAGIEESRNNESTDGGPAASD